MASSSAERKRWSWTAFADPGDQTLVLLSIVIGVLVGLVVVAFFLVIEGLAERLYPAESASWRRLLIPFFGALISGYLLHRYFPSARGSGVPQAKEALFIKNGYIGTKTVIGKFVCCSVSLASGIALGPEGPSVQIGAGIASVVGRRFGLGPRQVRALLPVGCAAALAAAFNTPIAAVLFALEEILGDFHAPVLGAAVLSSATSWMVLHLFLGDQPLFHTPAYKLVHPAEFGVYAVLGVVGGLGSACLIKVLLKLKDWFSRLPKNTLWFQPGMGGLVMGIAGFFVPGVLGIGFKYVDRVLNGDFPFETVLLLGLMRIVLTPVCYASGNAGGILGPSLFVGAMLGGAVGGAAHTLLPAITANPGAYALVGMGAAFAGIVRVPMTSVIMIFEMTRDYTIIVPLMIANMISFVISRVLQPEPIYEPLGPQEGLAPLAHESCSNPAVARVGEIMDREAWPLEETMDAASAKAFLESAGAMAWPIGEGRIVKGVVSGIQLEKAASPDMTLAEIVAEQPEFPHAHIDHQASYALDRMRGEGIDMLPVVSRTNIHELLGVVTLSHVLASYGLSSAGLSATWIPDVR
ncbi:MAG: chloride channel protein [Acidobacteriota bacterium]|nr:chloride channel protein [Acidobacteriota bacterium]